MGSAIDPATMSPQIRARYGLDRAPWPRRILIGTVLAAYAAVVLWVAVAVEDTPVESKLIVWQQAGPDRVDVTFEVRRDAATPVTCAIRAQDGDRTDVGYAEVEFPPGADYVQTTYLLRVLGAAVIAEVLDCRPTGEPLGAPGPQFPPGIAPPEQPWTATAP